tara:strand:+ start:60 stop:311 length:252 start_codon:yes stop_codon:yes gene_type:complete
MKIIYKTLVNLSSKSNPDRLGHISVYRKANGNKYYVYFLEQRYFGFKEVDKFEKMIEEESSGEHHYSLDIMFNDKDRYLGWNF